MKSQKNGFTLIELLVVIAIIAILAAILFPVFAQAKSAAKHSTNLAHVRQFSVAALSYANDHDDRFVTQHNHDILDDEGEFSYLLQPYIKNREIVYDVNRTRKGCSNYVDPTGRCIGFAPNFGLYGYRSSTGLFERPITTTISNSRGTETGSTWVGRSLTEPAEPSAMILILTTADTNMYTSSPYYQDGDGLLKSPRNGGKWVRTFVDGHASTVMMGAYRAWNAAGTSNAAYTVMPRSLKDMLMFCLSPDAIIAEQAYSGRTCKEAAEAVFAIRQPW